MAGGAELRLVASGAVGIGQDGLHPVGVEPAGLVRGRRLTVVAAEAEVTGVAGFATSLVGERLAAVFGHPVGAVGYIARMAILTELLLVAAPALRGVLAEGVGVLGHPVKGVGLLHLVAFFAVLLLMARLAVQFALDELLRVLLQPAVRVRVCGSVAATAEILLMALLARVFSGSA